MPRDEFHGPFSWRTDTSGPASSLMAHGESKTDRGRSWMVAACCCFCNLSFYGVARLSGLMLVAATHTFQVSRASAAVPFSLSTAIRNLAGVFVGHLGHRFGVGPVVAVGCVIASLGSGLCFFAKDIQWLTFCWGGLFGIGFGLCTCLLPLAINQYFAKHNGAAIGIAYSGSYIGSFVFPPIIVWLISNFELQGTFLIISGGILNVLVAAIFLKKPKSVKGSLQKATYNCDVGVMFDGITPEFKNDNYVSNNCIMLNSSSNSEFVGHSQNDTIRERRNKFNLNASISLGSNLYSVQDNFSCLHKEEIKKNNGRFNCNLNPTVSDRQSYSSKIFQKFHFKRRVQTDTQSKDYSSTPETSKDLVLASSHSTTSYNIQDSHQQSQCAERCLNENSKLDFVKTSAKENNIVSKGCKDIGLELRPLSKSKQKAKYKLKLHKIKKALEKLKKMTIQNRGHGFKTELAPNDNVQLLSFRYFPPFWCSYPLSIPESIKHKFVSPSTDSTKSTRQRKGIAFGFMRKFNNYTFALKENPKSEENVFPRGNLKITEQRIYLPILHNVYKNINNASSLEVQDNYSQNIMQVQTIIPTRFIHRSSLQTCETHGDYKLLNLPFNKGGVGCTCNNYNVSQINKTVHTDASYDIPNLSYQCLDHNVEYKPPNKRLESSTPLPRFPPAKFTKKCLPDWCRMFCEPMFVIISFSMAIQTFIVVCVVTTIEDFAKDVGIPENKVHYAIMALSTANLVGTLTLGAITDRGCISRHRFLSFCFLGMSMSLTAVSLVPLSLASLLSLMILHGLLESGLVITFPLLVRQFMEGERRQAVAIASSNVLSAPAVMLVPMLIGYFRDNIGCYSGLFHVLGATSFTCCLVWLVAPSLCQRNCSKKFKVVQATESFLN